MILPNPTVVLTTADIEEAVTAYLAKKGLTVVGRIHFQSKIERRADGPFDFIESASLTGCTLEIKNPLSDNKS